MSYDTDVHATCWDPVSLCSNLSFRAIIFCDDRPAGCWNDGGSRALIGGAGPAIAAMLPLYRYTLLLLFPPFSFFPAPPQRQGYACSV